MFRFLDERKTRQAEATVWKGFAWTPPTHPPDHLHDRWIYTIPFTNNLVGYRLPKHINSWKVTRRKERSSAQSIKIPGKPLVVYIQIARYTIHLEDIPSLKNLYTSYILQPLAPLCFVSQLLLSFFLFLVLLMVSWSCYFIYWYTCTILKAHHCWIQYLLCLYIAVHANVFSEGSTLYLDRTYSSYPLTEQKSPWRCHTTCNLSTGLGL